MNSLVENESNNLNTMELEDKDVIVHMSECQINKSKHKNIYKNKQTVYNDVCTASYVLGYN